MFHSAESEAGKCREWLSTQIVGIRGSLATMMATVSGNKRHLAAERKLQSLKTAVNSAVAHRTLEQRRLHSALTVHLSTLDSALSQMRLESNGLQNELSTLELPAAVASLCQVLCFVVLLTTNQSLLATGCIVYFSIRIGV